MLDLFTCKIDSRIPPLPLPYYHYLQRVGIFWLNSQTPVSSSFYLPDMRETLKGMLHVWVTCTSPLGASTHFEELVQIVCVLILPWRIKSSSCLLMIICWKLLYGPQRKGSVTLCSKDPAMSSCQLSTSIE